MKTITYFSDLETEDKLEIVLNNDDIMKDVYEMFYNLRMDQQQEEGELMLGKEHYKYIELHNHYSSFFLTLINWKEFIENLDFQYLCQEGIDLYNEIIELKKEYENIDIVENEDRFNELEDILENKSKDLLEICERQLHDFEDYNNDDITDFLKFEFENNGLYSDYYIIDNDKTKVYEDISYTKTFE